VALPGQLFYSTQIPVCLWFLARNKGLGRARHGETLFIDARKLGTLIDRVHRELSDEDIAKIADTYHAWKSDRRGEALLRPYEDVAGFCKSATIKEIAEQGYVLTPGRYVGAPDVEEDEIPFDEKMKSLTETLGEQFLESDNLEKSIRENLKRIGYEF